MFGRNVLLNMLLRTLFIHVLDLRFTIYDLTLLRGVALFMGSFAVSSCFPRLRRGLLHVTPYGVFVCAVLESPFVLFRATTRVAPTLPPFVLFRAGTRPAPTWECVPLLFRATTSVLLRSPLHVRVWDIPYLYMWGY